MNHSMYSADRRTHFKVVVVGFLCAIVVLVVGLSAHNGHTYLRDAPIVKAGGLSIVSGELPAIR
jgi:hypothetical protein